MEVSCSFTLIPIIIVAGNNQTGLVSATLFFRIRPITISSEWNTHNAFRAICIDIFVKIPSCQSVSSRSQWPVGICSHQCFIYSTIQCNQKLMFIKRFRGSSVETGSRIFFAHNRCVSTDIGQEHRRNIKSYRFTIRFQCAEVSLQRNQLHTRDGASHYYFSRTCCWNTSCMVVLCCYFFRCTRRSTIIPVYEMFRVGRRL